MEETCFLCLSNVAKLCLSVRHFKAICEVTAHTFKSAILFYSFLSPNRSNIIFEEQVFTFLRLSICFTMTPEYKSFENGEIFASVINIFVSGKERNVIFKCTSSQHEEIYKVNFIYCGLSTVLTFMCRSLQCIENM